MSKKRQENPTSICGLKVNENYQKKDRILALVLALLGIAVCIVSVTVFAGGESISASYDYTIVIDPGHGGIDKGVTGTQTGVYESDLNLAISFILKKEFEKHGFKAVLTRTDKNGLYGIKSPGFKRRDMEKRKEIVLSNKANMVLSIHMNKFALTYRKGPQVFFDSSSASSRLLANKMQTVLNKFTGNSHKALSGDYYMLKCTESPSVIVECGFLSNAEDERNLCKESYQKQLASKLLEGVMLYLASGDQKLIKIN